jgi:nucleotide-binding universal stress UspA family protein
MAMLVAPDRTGNARESMNELRTKCMDRVVVVGVDGSPGSRVALEYAVEDAARRGARLRVVAAVPPPEYLAIPYGMGAYGMGVPPLRDGMVAEARTEAQRLVDDVVAA